MERRWLKVLTAVAIAAGAAACDAPAPVAPRASTPSPSAVSPRLTWNSTGYYVGNWRLLRGNRVASQTRYGIIDGRGGKVNVGASSLVVPAGAVRGATLFVFTLQTEPYLSAKLTAFGLSGEDRGHLVTTFGQALTLKLSYADASRDVPDPAQAKLLWMEDETLLGVEPTSLDLEGKKLIAPITHFTDYTPGVPRDGDSAFQVQ